MPTTITKRLEIDAGHRLLNHEGKCRHVHGHRYAFELTCSAASLDGVGRIVDFSVIKERVGGWLGERWDHAFIAQIGDPIAEVLRAEGLRLDVLPCPPTAEHLARVLFEEACALLRGTGVRLEHVRCYETPTCWADYAP